MPPATAMDYFELLNKAKSLEIPPDARTIRLALLADFSTQQLSCLLQVLGADAGLKLEIYEGGYDNLDFEVLDKGSGLYAFAPEFVFILPATQALKAKFYASTEREGFAGATIDRLKGLWSVLKTNASATIIQSNFIAPSERAFGNYELKVPTSLGATFALINHEMPEAAGDAGILIFDIDHLAGEQGRRQWFDDRLWAMAKMPCRLDNLPLLARGLVDITRAASGQIVKCVVVDLDNTLWGGIIADDGVSGIVLGDFDEGESFVAFQQFLAELKRRGILLAVVSKNDHANAVQPFREHPNMVLKEEDFAVFLANWENKAENIRKVQQVLNIGLDCMVFVDDNPFERELVRSFLPQVIVPELPEDPSGYLRCLADLNLFETASFSAADRERSAQYAELAKSNAQAAQFDRYEDYLASLDMRARLERFHAGNLPRIVQLLQRSNQFNLMTQRYGQAACEKMMATPDRYAPFTVTLSDKFTNHGLICVVVLSMDKEQIDIAEYVMSCRVLRRGVEALTMNAILAFAARNNSKIVGHYRPTAKNGMVRDFYAGFGFAPISGAKQDEGEWTIAPQEYVPKEHFLTLDLCEL